MKQLFVAAAILVKEGKVLLTQRGPRQSMAGQWEFPGGKVEAGETPEESLSRELFEELNLRIDRPEFFTEVLHAYPSFRIRLRAFLVRQFSGQLVLREHAAYVWLEAEELLNYDLTEADVPIARQLVSAPL